jgi:3-hydroxybutyryl-CoA dehydratase
VSTYSEPGLFIETQETFSRVITEGEVALYAGLVGDNRHQVVAGEVVFPKSQQRTPANPLLLVGFIGGLLNTHMPGEGSHYVTLQHEFLAPVYCGDRIDTVIKLIEFDPVKHLATFRTDCFNQDNDQVITGQAIMLVPSRYLPTSGGTGSKRR